MNNEPNGLFRANFFKILKYDFANILNQLLCIVQLKYKLVKISTHYVNPLDPSKGGFCP